MKVSVFLPNFNHAKYLPRCIESVRAQSHDDWELIVVDDASTDDSWSIVSAYQVCDSRIIGHRFAQNRGANAAARHALSMCSGDVVYGTAADDLLCNPRTFEMALSQMDRHSTAAGAFGISEVVQIDGRPLWQMGAYGKGACHIEPARAISDFFGGRLFIPGASALWKRDLVNRYGGLDETLGPQSDYYLNHALAMIHGVVYLDTVLSVTRLSSDSYGNSADHEAFFERHARVEKKWRTVAGATALPHAGLRQWRANVINGRLSLERQLRLVRLWDECFSGLQEWERAGLLAEFKECEQFLNARCSALKGRLGQAKSIADQIFDEVAGPLESDRTAETPKGDLLRRARQTIRSVRARVRARMQSGKRP
jgi:glycosyltransferase involved in cell wall biosynthesis